jgi:hypothetical protein
MKKVENTGFEVVVCFNEEQIVGYEHPKLVELSEQLNCIGEADGTFDFGQNVENALLFSRMTSLFFGNYTNEIYHITVYNDGDVVWEPLTTEIYYQYAK